MPWCGSVEERNGRGVDTEKGQQCERRSAVIRAIECEEQATRRTPVS